MHASHRRLSRVPWLVLPLVVVSWLFQLSSPTAAQTPCPACAGRGERSCRRCPVEREARVPYCSVAAQCVSCAGALATPCPTCKAAATDLSARAARIAAAHELRRGRLAPAKLTRPPLLLASPNVELWFGLRPLPDIPERDAHAQAHLYLERLDAAALRLAKLLARAPAAPEADGPVVGLLADDGELERLSAHLGTIEPQGAGVLDFDRRIALLQGADQKDAALHRLVVHAFAQVAIAPHLAGAPRTWESLRIGLAHWLAADLAGACDAIPVLDRPQSATRYFGGNWRIAARELLEANALPDLDELLEADPCHYDLAAHATVFAAADWLIAGAQVAPHTGSAAPAEPLLVRAMAAARAGQTPTDALSGLLAGGGKLAPHLHTWVRTKYPRR